MPAAAVVSAGALAVTGALALPAGAATARPVASSSLHKLTVRKIAFGATLHHSFVVSGVRHVEALAGPDDLGQLGDHLFVGFQNGIGPQGQASTDGNLDSTIVEFTLSGAEVRQWDVRGKVDGLYADPFISSVIATVNEDGNSSLYTIRIPTGWVTHYACNRPLPHLGGSDAISIFHGRIFISASAPGTGGTPPPHAPAVYVVSLHWQTRVASIKALYSDESVATLANGPHAGTPRRPLHHRRRHRHARHRVRPVQSWGHVHRGDPVRLEPRPGDLPGARLPGQLARRDQPQDRRDQRGGDDRRHAEPRGHDLCQVVAARSAQPPDRTAVA